MRLTRDCNLLQQVNERRAWFFARWCAPDDEFMQAMDDHAIELDSLNLQACLWSEWI